MINYLKAFVVLTFLISTPFTSEASIFQVGTSKQYKKPSEVMSKVADGDTVEIDAGVYSKDVGRWTKNNLLIRGVGGKAHLKADGANSGGKAIWVITGNNTTVENIEFSGATVPDKNGAGIRQEGEGLTVRRCFFHDNEDGILCGANQNSDILIEFSEFARNGYGDGYSHNLYIGNIRSLTFRFNYTHHAKVGHNFKSRANNNYILYNFISDSADGNSSMLIDLPNGGLSFVIGNVIVQGPNAENNKMLNYGVEGLINPDKRLYVVNNTFVNYRSTCTYVFIQSGTAEAKIINNIFCGNDSESSAFIAGTAEQMNNVRQQNISSILFENESSYNFRLQPLSPALDAGIDPGAVDGYPLIPVFEYLPPCDSISRKFSENADAGAYEHLPETGVQDINSDNSNIKFHALYDRIIVTTSVAEPATIAVYDIAGTLIFSTSFNSSIQEIPTSSLSAGIYLCEIRSTNFVKHYKYIKY